MDLQKEISGKNVLDKKNKDFEKNIRDNAQTTLNISTVGCILEKTFTKLLQMKTTAIEPYPENPFRRL